jgi:multiple sugar transport system permease protein
MAAEANPLVSAPPPTTPTGENARKRRTALAFWAFVTPLVLGLIVFVYVPIIWGLYLSFFEARGTITPQEFVGLQNYVAILNDERFIKSMVTIILFTLFIVPTTFFASLGLAMLVNRVTRGKAVFRTVFFIPTAVSYVVASLIWRMSLFNGLAYGFANMVLYWIGGETAPVIVWIGTPRPPWYWLVLVSCRLWLQIGFYMIIFIAGLQEIPRSLYEAAYVDGAKRGWTTFRHITFPMLRNTSIAVVLLLCIEAFKAFDEFYNILGGTAASTGNQLLARPPLVYLYSMAFTEQNYGRGSAGAFILTAVIIIFTIFQSRIFGFGESTLDND